MSLIPSESLNFPDSFRASVGWRRSAKPGDPPEEGMSLPNPSTTGAVAEIESPDSGVLRTIARANTTPAFHAEPSASVAVHEEDLQLELLPLKAPIANLSVPKADPPASIPVPEKIQVPPVERPIPKPTFRLVPDPIGPQSGPGSVKPAPVHTPQPGVSKVLERKEAEDKAPAPEEIVPLPIQNETRTTPQAEERVEATSHVEDKLEAGSPAGDKAPITPTVEDKIEVISPVESNVEVTSPATSSANPENHGDREPKVEAAESAETGKPVALRTESALELHPIQEVVSTPAQANHIFELIAAAVQRGVITGGPVPVESETPVAKETTEIEPIAPAQPETAPEPAADQPVTESAESVIDHSVPQMTAQPNEVATSVGAKMPARIRITPRKIKPRVQVPLAPEPEITAPLSPGMLSGPPEIEPGIVDLISDSEEEEHAAPSPPRASPIPVRAPAPAPAPPPPPPPAPVATIPASPPKLSPRDVPTRKINATRLDLSQSDLALFTARERRNRWIGFGLSELVALAALISLLWFGFAHRFSDPTLKLLVFILVFAVAAIAVALPIVFVRNDPARWQR